MNCAGSNQSENSQSAAASYRNDSDINTFSQNPPPIEGNAGFQFLLKEYLAPHCGSCHNNVQYFGAPYFDINNTTKSYELSKVGLTRQDMIMRVTNNPFCPTCKLNPNGEVYKAIMYWLDHR